MDDFLLFLVIAGALAWLWRRVVALEREVVRLRDAPYAVAAARTKYVPDEAPAVPDTLPAAAEPLEPAPTEPEVTASGTMAWRPRFDFEDLFGRLLPIWAGGVTLGVAGFFLVRWSIDAGLLTPPVRVLLAGLFGGVLIAGAEIAYRWREKVADPRVAQALAGAGLATLYAAFYLAGSTYGLIGSSLALVGLAAVTAAAIGLSFRFGLPSAVLGLVGGFAAPALVGSEDANLPLLTLYLALVTAGLAFTGKRQNRAWLGLAALAGGLGWGALLTVSGVVAAPDVAVVGAYLVLLGGILPALVGGSGRPQWIVRVGAAALAALQLAVLIQQGGFGALEWGLYLLLGNALAWFGWRQPAMREVSAVAAAVGVALLAFWPVPEALGFAAVSGGIAAIFAGVPLAQIWRGHGRALDLLQTGGVALGLAMTALGQFGAVIPANPAPVLALALFALACLPAAAVDLASAAPESEHKYSLIAAQGAAALLGFGAVAQVLPEDALAWIAAVAAALVAWRAPKLAGASATLAILAALWALAPLSEWLRQGTLALAGAPMDVADLPSMRTVALHLLPAVAAGAAWSTRGLADNARRVIGAATMVAATVATHIAFRHAFAALAGTNFVMTGVIERAVWEAILLGAAWFASTRGWRTTARALVLAALAHFTWSALVLHNPLWSAQAVGPLPLANALLPAFAAGLAALWLLRRLAPNEPRVVHHAFDAAVMLVVALLALTELRQLFAGSLLTASPVGQGEDLLRSLTGIVVAIGFLLWGARIHERSWRIGSLVLMVVAVLKVFLFDAASLAGLGRIASFMALGFSLIGIGWFYNRQLRGTASAAVTP